MSGDRAPADIPPRRPPPVPDDVDEDPAEDQADEDQAGEDGEDQAGEDGEDQPGEDEAGDGGGRRLRPGSALAGAIVGLFAWPIAMAWITGGQAGAEQWLRAKFLNQVPDSKPAAKTTAAA